MKTTDFQGTYPRMTLEGYFAGRTRAWGLFQDRFGNVRRQFSVDITGVWDTGAQQLELTEEFHYDDGVEETRVWHIRKLDDSNYRATTDDLKGDAEISAHGNAVNLRYRMEIPINGKRWALDFDDWMFRQDAEVVINRALVTKWGLQVGTATIFFKKDAQRGSGHGKGEHKTKVTGMPRQPRTEQRDAAE